MYFLVKGKIDYCCCCRRLHLVKGSNGLDYCPVTGCEHAGFASKRGCRKHVKTKHGWYYYFDEKPTVCTCHVQ